MRGNVNGSLGMKEVREEGTSAEENISRMPATYIYIYGGMRESERRRRVSIN